MLSKTLKNVSAAWIKHQEVVIGNDKIVDFRVNLKVPFVLEE